VEPGDDVGDLMHRADAAMYRSKTAGGDRVSLLSY
jgi:GGDEF domain-containing protein